MCVCMCVCVYVCVCACVKKAGWLLQDTMAVHRDMFDSRVFSSAAEASGNVIFKTGPTLKPVDLEVNVLWLPPLSLPELTLSNATSAMRPRTFLEFSCHDPLSHDSIV
jgi:hypothetical protein